MAQRPPVISEHYPYVPVRFAVGGATRTPEAMVDTGFDGALIVPESVADLLPTEDEWTPWRLADGSVTWMPLYLATLQVGSFATFAGTVHVVGDEYLVGRAVIDRFSVTFDHGRHVEVRE